MLALEHCSLMNEQQSPSGVRIVNSKPCYHPRPCPCGRIEPETFKTAVINAVVSVAP